MSIAATSSTWAQAAAAIVLGAALLETVVLVVSGLRRRAYEGRHRHLTLELLGERVEEAKTRRRTERQQAELAWNGLRKFEVRRIVQEGGGICSFYLAAHDAKPLAPYQPGQFLTFQLKIPGQNKPTVRCYSLSDCFRDDQYRVSIKKLPAPPGKPDAAPGLASSFFHEQIKEGDIVDVRAPAGHFVLDLSRQTPLVLVGGGVGVTPVMSMLNAIVESGSTRETWFFYGVRSRCEHIMADHLKRLDREHDNIHVQVCYSNAGDAEVQGRDYDHAERISVELFKRVLPSNNYEFYICGPPPMMTSLVAGLGAWRVPKDMIKFEAFGPASIKKTAPPSKQKGTADSAIAVTFSKSKRTVKWNASDGSLLDFAEAQGIALESGCRAGNCGTCLVAIKSGEVGYVNEPGVTIEPGTCLTCVAVPKSELRIDA